MMYNHCNLFLEVITFIPNIEQWAHLRSSLPTLRRFPKVKLCSKYSGGSKVTFCPNYSWRYKSNTVPNIAHDAKITLCSMYSCRCRSDTPFQIQLAVQKQTSVPNSDGLIKMLCSKYSRRYKSNALFQIQLAMQAPLRSPVSSHSKVRYPLPVSPNSRVSIRHRMSLLSVTINRFFTRASHFTNPDIDCLVSVVMLLQSMIVMKHMRKCLKEVSFLHVGSSLECSRP